MPPLTSVTIPVIRRSESSGDRIVDKDKGLSTQGSKPRTYNEDPLPIKPSERASKNAQLVRRAPDGVTYQVKIGSVEINNVGIDEILDYVSALDLENYENRQFEEEREVMKVAEEEKKRERAEKLERMKQRAKQKGVVIFEDVTSANVETEGGEGQLGRRDRPRPTYNKFYKQANVRRRRKRDPSTGELMPFSDEDEEPQQSSEDEPTVRLPTHGPPLAELPKRRRRKRDKVTGELLPFSVPQPPALEEKRRRRKRHPLTGKLMPIGWRYVPDDGGDTYERRRDGGDASPSFRKLSISEAHIAKRPRLDSESSVSRSSSPLPTKAEIMAKASPHMQQHTSIHGDKMTPSKATVLEILTSHEESEAGPVTGSVTRLKPQPTPAGSRPSGNSMLKGTAVSSAAESSPEPERRTSVLSPYARKKVEPSSSYELLGVTTSRRAQGPATSILNSSAARTSTPDPLAPPSEDEEDSETDVDDDEWLVEGILAHHVSDPKSHPQTFGKDPVMLYHVKWEGYNKPTWEPLESFGDRSLVRAYRRRVGLGPDPNDNEHEDAGDVTIIAPNSTDALAHPPTSTKLNAQVASNTNDNDEILGDDGYEYEIEAILRHQLSDPKTHPPALGKSPVMLYNVKWKGYDEATWEPAESFEDPDVLREYNRRMGLKNAGEDVEMTEAD